MMLWDPRLLDCRGPVRHAVQTSAVSPDGQVAVCWCMAETAGGRLGCLRLWDPVSGTHLSEFLFSEVRDVKKVIFSPDGKRMHLVPASTPGVRSIAMVDLKSPPKEIIFPVSKIETTLLKAPFDESCIIDAVVSKDGDFDFAIDVSGALWFVRVGSNGQTKNTVVLNADATVEGADLSENGLGLCWGSYAKTADRNRSRNQSEILTWNLNILNDNLHVCRLLSDSNTGRFSVASLVPASAYFVAGTNTGNLGLWSYNDRKGHDTDGVEMLYLVKAHDGKVLNLTPSTCGRLVHISIINTLWKLSLMSQIKLFIITTPFVVL